MKLKLIVFSTLLLIIISACGGNTSELKDPAEALPPNSEAAASATRAEAAKMEAAATKAVPTVEVEAAASETVPVTEEESPAEVNDTPDNPIDTTSLDVCALLPQDAVAAVIGSLRDAPEPGETIGDERGCTYVNDQGYLYSIIIMPLDRWEIIKAVQTAAVDFPDVGDEALLLEQGSTHSLYVLLDGKAALQINNTTEDTAVSAQLAQITIDNLN